LTGQGWGANNPSRAEPAEVPREILEFMFATGFERVRGPLGAVT
jgi:hypothetical protein